MKILAKVSYLGTSYSGWQKQPNFPSVQEEIEKVLSKIFNSSIQIYGSGRTDAGVHAKGQTFHFEINKPADLVKLKYSLNMMLPNDIEILTLEEVDDSFQARYSAKGKHYQYVIKKCAKDPFLFHQVYLYPYPLDMDLFQASLNKFIGKHNFASFTSKDEDEQDFVREIYSIQIKEDNDFIYVDLIGNGFMRYMIRNIIGTSLVIASKKEDISFIDKRLDNSNRQIVSYKAPSDGLYLIDVIY